MTDLLPSIYYKSRDEAGSAIRLRRDEYASRSKMKIEGATVVDVATAMKQEITGLNFTDRRWQLRKYIDTFLGHEFVDWLVATYSDINNRSEALEHGNRLQREGLFRHVHSNGATAEEDRRLLECVVTVLLRACRLTLKHSAYAFYVLAPELSDKRSARSWFKNTFAPAALSRTSSPDAAPPPKQTDSDRQSLKSNGRRTSEPDEVDRDKATITRSTVIDLDPAGRSDRAETAWLHYDAVCSLPMAYHFHVSSSSGSEEGKA